MVPQIKKSMIALGRFVEMFWCFDLIENSRKMNSKELKRFWVLGWAEVGEGRKEDPQWYKCFLKLKNLWLYCIGRFVEMFVVFWFDWKFLNGIVPNKIKTRLNTGRDKLKAFPFSSSKTGAWWKGASNINLGILQSA